MEGQAALAHGEVVLSTADFEVWVRSSSVRFRRLAYLLTGDLHQAEDLLQSAYAKVLPKWPKIAAHDDPPDAYVYRVMVNLRTSWWRRSRGREWSTDQVPDPPRPDGTAELDEKVVESQVLLDALRALPRRQRTAVILRHWCDLSLADTAAVMDCSVGTVKSNAARGLAHLRAVLSQHTESSDSQKGGRR